MVNNFTNDNTPVTQKRNTGNKVRIPQLAIPIEEVVKMYYNNIVLSNNDIRTLFGKLSSATISRLKKLAFEKMLEENIPSFNDIVVNTEAAYRAWGIDIKDLEYRIKKLKEITV